jgi:hypothetical protein
MIKAERREDKTIVIYPHKLAAELEKLTPLQKGVFLQLLLHQWLDDMLPVSTTELARLAGTSPQHMGQSRKKLDDFLGGEYLA